MISTWRPTDRPDSPRLRARFVLTNHSLFNLSLKARKSDVFRSLSVICFYLEALSVGEI